MGTEQASSDLSWKLYDMKKWILSIFLLALNSVVIFWAVSYQFVTFAQIMPTGVQYVAGDKASIDSAIIKVRSDTTEGMREFFTRPVLILSGLTLFNLVICLFLLLKKSKDSKTIPK